MKKTLSYMGFAKKAGALVTGSGTCEVMIKKGRVKLLLIAQDPAEGSQKKACSMADNNGVPYVIYGTSEELSHITGGGKKNIFGITDEGFATAIAAAIDKEKKETGKRVGLKKDPGGGAAGQKEESIISAEKENCKEVSGWQKR